MGGGGLSADDLRFSRTVARHLDDVTKDGRPARPYMNSRQLLQEIMDAQPPRPDPGGVPGGLRWDVPGHIQKTEGTWELVVDPNTNIILHWVFKRRR